jgi:hypothetical protein
MAAYWEILLRVPGARQSDTAAVWFNRAFRNRRIKAAAFASDENPFAKVRAYSDADLNKVISLITADPTFKGQIAQDAHMHYVSTDKENRNAPA